MIELNERPQTLTDLQVTDADRAKVRSLLQPPPALPALYDGLRAPNGTMTHAVTAVWAPASSRRIRAVESLLVAGVLGYFAAGLLQVLGLF